MNLQDIFMAEKWNTSAFLAKHTGRYILLNITRRGLSDAACLNVTKTGSASCRFLNDDLITSVSLNNHEFQLTPETLYLPYRVINSLGNYFETIRCMIPNAAFNKKGRVCVGHLSRDSKAIRTFLGSLQTNGSKLRSIYDSLQTDINTPIYNLRKKTKKPITLANTSGLCKQGEELLKAYSESLCSYVRIPELCRFGNENTSRSKVKPNKRDARLRYWMEMQKKNPLDSEYNLNFVSHELKPLNIAGRNLNWNCNGNPRTDSIDLLLEYDDSPVITEVKMAGDSFLSVAAVQLWYYAAVLASESQKNRINRWFDCFSEKKKPWLGLLAQARDENNRKEQGFSEDLNSVLSFLRNSKTKKAMGQRFGGAFVLIIEEKDDAYAIAKNGEFKDEFKIEWSSS